MAKIPDDEFSYYDPVSGTWKTAKMKFSVSGDFISYRDFPSGPLIGKQWNSTPVEKPKKPELKDAVAEQLEQLTADLDWVAPSELPTPERDLTTYQDAFNSAVKNCPHSNYHELLYRREYICDDCNKFLTRKDISKGFFGW